MSFMFIIIILSSVYIASFKDDFKDEDVGVVALAIAVITVIAIIVGFISSN